MFCDPFQCLKIVFFNRHFCFILVCRGCTVYFYLRSLIYQNNPVILKFDVIRIFALFLRDQFCVRNPLFSKIIFLIDTFRHINKMRIFCCLRIFPLRRFVVYSVCSCLFRFRPYVGVIFIDFRLSIFAIFFQIHTFSPSIRHQTQINMNDEQQNSN